MPNDEESFRALLDEGGVLRPGSAVALAPPARASTFAVFSQRPDARLDVGALRASARRFFATKLGLTVDKTYGERLVETDAARVVVASEDGAAAGTRLIYGRRTTADDFAAADAAERAQGTTGLAALAQRCPTIWLVVPESDDDRAALTIAAVFASVMLGPILPPTASGIAAEIFGVRTARLKLEAKARPYR